MPGDDGVGERGIRVGVGACADPSDQRQCAPFMDHTPPYIGNELRSASAIPAPNVVNGTLIPLPGSLIAVPASQRSESLLQTTVLSCGLSCWRFS